MTLREYIIFWQETYDRYQSRSTTYAAHNYVFKNHILPDLGDTQLSELTSEMVGEFLEERRRFAIIDPAAPVWAKKPCGTSTACFSNAWIKPYGTVS